MTSSIGSDSSFTANSPRKGASEAWRPKETTHHRDPSKSSENLDEAEEDQATSTRGAPAVVIHEILRKEGEADSSPRPGAVFFWSGLAAGLSMGFSFLATALIQSELPECPPPDWQRRLFTGLHRCLDDSSSSPKAP